MKSELRLVVAACFACLVCSTASGQKFVQITPDWVSKNPGRLQLASGTAVNGSNSYTFRFFVKEPQSFEVSSALYRKQEPGRMVYTSRCTLRRKEKSVDFGAIVYPNEGYDVVFRIEERIYYFDNGKKLVTGGILYSLRLADFADADLPEIEDP